MERRELTPLRRLKKGPEAGPQSSCARRIPSSNGVDHQGGAKKDRDRGAGVSALVILHHPHLSHP